MATNLSDPVTIWTDSVGGQSWEKAAPPNQPTWTAGSGVHFTTGDYLANGAFPVPTYEITNAILVICKFDSVGIGPVIGSGGTIGVGANGGQWYNPLAGSFGTVVTSKTYDYIITSEHVDSVLVGRIYTNGVFAINGSGINGLHPTRLGYNGSWSFQGEIYEIIVWDCATNWNLTDIANVHRYATNAYSFSP